MSEKRAAPSARAAQEPCYHREMLRFLSPPEHRLAPEDAPRAETTAKGHVAAIVAIALATGGVGCGDDEPLCPTGAPNIASFTVDPTTASPGDTLEATLVVENFELGGGDAHAHAHPLTAPLHADEGDVSCPGGHVHVYLDDVMTNPLVMIEATTFSIPLPSDLDVGEHRLIARLQNHDHTIVKPEVTAEAAITIVVP